MATNLSYKNDEDQDERLDPYALKNREQETANSQFDGIADNFDKDADDSQENKNIEKAKAAEESGDSGWNTNVGGDSGSKKGSGRFLGARKKSASAFISIGLLGGGLGVSFFSGPALLIVNLKEVFSNYGSSTSRVATVRSKVLMNYMLNNKDSEKACAKSPGGVRCKLGTMSEKQRTSYEKAGFKIDGKDVNGRTQIKSITFPDGEKTTSGKAFNDYAKKNPSAGSAALRAHNPRTMVFNGGRFASKVLVKFGVTKQKVKLTGGDEKERKESFNKVVGSDSGDTDEDRKSKFDKKHGSKLRASSVKGGVLSAVPAIACTAYNVARTTVATVKLENSLRFVGFAMMFLKAADQIKDEGDVDPETIATLGAILTSYHTSGAKKGLSATDSQGYKIAAYGGEGKLSSFSRNYLLGGSPQLIAIDGTLNWLNDKAGGKQHVRAGCKAATSFIGGAAMTGAICAGSGTGGAVAGTVVPIAGNIAGAVVGVGVCVLTTIAGGLVIGWALGKAIGWALPYIVNALKDAPIDADIKGVDAGNAIAAGAGTLLNTTSLSRGLKPGTKGEVSQFLASTIESEREYEEIARYDAQKTPFDVYNEYSFLGSFVRKSGLITAQSNSAGGALTTIGSILGSSFSLVPKTLATDSMPINVTNEDLSHCEDADRSLSEIGVDCDRMGIMQLVLSNKELAMSVETNLNFMEPTYADEASGQPVPDTRYEKWTKYCTEQREDLMGSSSQGIEVGSNEDQKWYTGELCVKASEGVTEEMLSNFRVYYNTSAEKEDADTVAQTSSGGASLRVASYNILGKSHTNPGPGQDKDSNLGDWKDRIAKVASNVTSNNIDIIGFQEFEGDQRKYLDDNLTGYERSTHGKESDSIMWNTSKFSKTGQGTWRTTYFSGAIDEPWVKLKDNSSGQEFFFMSLHDPINNGQGNATVRYENAKKHLKKIQELQPQAPVIIVGDFNNGFRKTDGSDMLSDEKTAYCVLSNGGMLNGQDAVKNQTFKCSGKPRPDEGSDISSNIDHVYVSQGLDVSSYTDINSPESGSDHPAIIADVVMPGGEDSESGAPGGAVAGDDYKECSQYLNSGYYCPGQGYAYQCTAFVNFRLAKHGVINKTDIVAGTGSQVVAVLGIPAHDKDPGNKYKFETGKTPQVNSVFSTPSGGGGAGHTGMVSKVNADGSIVIEEYNYSNPKAYSTRTLTKSQYSNFTFAYTGGSYK